MIFSSLRDSPHVHHHIKDPEKYCSQQCQQQKKLGCICIYLIKRFPEHFEDLCVISRTPLLNWHIPAILASGLIASVDGEILPNMSLK